MIGAWVRSKDNPEALSMITLNGEISENEILASDRLAIILSHKLPEVQKPVIRFLLSIDWGHISDYNI